MTGVTRVSALVWADAVMEGCFFIMQIYLTSVWKLSFTKAAAFLNIWGGIYRILPIFFLFLADKLLGNVATLALSGILSTTGLVLISVGTAPLFGNSITRNTCQETEGVECVGHTVMVLFITGMALVALGRAARIACTQPFLDDQVKHDKVIKAPVVLCAILFFVTPVTVIIAFPYVKKWYVLFGFSAGCTATATIFYLTGVCKYTKPEKKDVEGNPISDFCRVLVAAALKMNKPLPKDDAQLYRIEGEKFGGLSSSRMLRFLNKAAIIVPGDIDAQGDVIRNERSWKLCSVSRVESVKRLIRLAPMWSCFILCGVVSSTGNTYFVEQAKHMNSDIGNWNAPLQLLLLVFSLAKCSSLQTRGGLTLLFRKNGAIPVGVLTTVYSTVCCAVAAAMERSRVHTLRRHHLLDQPDDVKVPMSAAWLYFQIGILAYVDVTNDYNLSSLFESGAPRPVKRYAECFTEGVVGLGFISSSLLVYVVGKISERGGSKNWFQHNLNKSRLDRYYWVLTVLCSVNAIAFIVAAWRKIKHAEAKVDDDDDNDSEIETEIGLAAFCISKNSAFGILVSQNKGKLFRGPGSLQLV